MACDHIIITRVNSVRGWHSPTRAPWLRNVHRYHDLALARIHLLTLQTSLCCGPCRWKNNQCILIQGRQYLDGSKWQVLHQSLSWTPGQTRYPWYWREFNQTFQLHKLPSTLPWAYLRTHHMLVHQYPYTLILLAHDRSLLSKTHCKPPTHTASPKRTTHPPMQERTQHL